MRDAQKPDHVSLNTLISRLSEGRFVIPDFQREFEWKPWDVNDLMRSIFSDYYIGSLLLWKGKDENFDALSCESIYGFDGPSRPEHIVLDGQQRLTAMYYAFFAPDKELPSRNNRYYYFISVDKLMAEETEDAFGYDWTIRWRKLIVDPQAQYSQHIFPLYVMGQQGWALSTWAQGYEAHWTEKAVEAEAKGELQAHEQALRHAANAKKFGELLKGITDEYQISYIELDRQLEIDKVCDIFTKLNNTGVQLDTFDLLNALLKPKGLQLKAMYRDAAEKLSFVETEKMNTYILQVMSLLRQGYCSPKYIYYLVPGHARSIRAGDGGGMKKEILIPNVSDFRTRWDSAVDALKSAIDLLRHPQEFGVSASGYLPYVSILPAFAALQWHITTLPAHRQLDAQRKLRHWYWASVFQSRYSGSVESTSARDFLDMKEWFDSDDEQPGLIRDFEERFRSLDLRKEQRRGTSIYNGIFNLLVINSPRDWMTGNVPQYGELDDHHIIPKSKADELGVGSLIHTILNRTPLTKETNRNVVRDRWPSEYLPELISQSGESTVRSVLESHFVSAAALEVLLRNPFGKADFEEFLSERNRTISEAIENLLIKERLDLSPQLRELDERLDKVELSLRVLIADALGNNLSSLPSHVKQKVDERYASSVRKNPGLERDDYRNLHRQLEFADLRELQETITNSSLWPLFSDRFLNKENLNIKFNQFGELRNGIRHSRSVHEVARMEGEAAIIWFEQVLR